MVGGTPTFWGLFILIFRNIYYNMFHLSRESCGFTLILPVTLIYRKSSIEPPVG